MKEIENEFAKRSGEFDEFLAIGSKNPERNRYIVFCEECSDFTIVIGGSGASCGHTTRWQRNLRAYFEQVAILGAEKVE